MKASEMFGPLPPDPPALLTALELLARGFWPIPITSPDDARATAPGKQPIGVEWGVAPHTRDSLRAAWKAYPKAGIGLKLGKDAGYIDVEIDDPDEGAGTLAMLFGGEVVDTMGWTSTRGEHRVFRWDDRLARYGKPVLKTSTGFRLPGVEIRIGSMNGDGKQFQSVCPPSADAEGRPRVWNEFLAVAPLPDSFFSALDRLADEGTKPVPAPATVPFERSPLGSARSRYGLAALDRELATLESAPEGSRNDQLNRSAFALGNLVTAGCLAQAETETVLRLAALKIGLDPKETEATIRSGMTAGMAEARDVSHVGREVVLKASGSEEAATSQPPVAWEAPILDESIPAMAFPIDILPPELAWLVYEASTCLTCPPDYPAVTALAVAGAAIGRSLAARIKRSWSECPTIFVALVGRPGTTKSPALSLMTRPLWVIAEEFLARHKREMERHKQEQGRDGAVPEPAPVLERIAVNDTTCEALAPILAENPHGLVMVRDELTAWVAALNQYKTGGKGSDRQFFLSTWSGSPVVVDRKGDRDKGPIHIPHPFLCVVGGLTPDMLGELSDSRGRDDGFIDRLLFTLPEPVKIRWNVGSVSEESTEGWLRVVRRLRGRAMKSEGDERPRPYFAEFEPEALDLYADWFNANQREAEQDDFPRHLDGAWSKMRAYCGRFALILDQLHRAYDPTDDGEDVTIRAESVRRAIRLVDYFRNHCRRVRALLRGASAENLDGRAILKWIAHTDRREFSERDVRHNFPGRFGGSDADLGQALAWLRGRHCIRPAVVEEKPRGRGRPASQRFEVNPALFDGINGDYRQFVAINGIKPGSTQDVED